MWIRHNLGYSLFVATLTACSVFFTLQVEAFRSRTTGARLHGDIAPGTAVRVLEVIDGDEVLVQKESGSRFVVRLLGIKSFDPATNAPGLGAIARSCVSALEEAVLDKTVTLELTQQVIDSRGRLLAYVHASGTDVGKELVAAGLSLVFVRYPFARERAYRGAQQQARNADLGLWGIPGAAERARALLQVWEAERAP